MYQLATQRSTFALISAVLKKIESHHWLHLFAISRVIVNQKFQN